MPLLRRNTNQARSAGRRRLKELTEHREQGLRDLGRLTVAMHQHGSIDGERLLAKAADVAAIDDEIRRLQHGESSGESTGSEAPGVAEADAESGPENAGPAGRSGAARSRA